MIIRLLAVVACATILAACGDTATQNTEEKKDAPAATEEKK